MKMYFSINFFCWALIPNDGRGKTILDDDLSYVIYSAFFIRVHKPAFDYSFKERSIIWISGLLSCPSMKTVMHARYYFIYAARLSLNSLTSMRFCLFIINLIFQYRVRPEEWNILVARKIVDFSFCLYQVQGSRRSLNSAQKMT
jgi:hypothetical protein